jgi:inner membrane protein
MKGHTHIYIAILAGSLYFNYFGGTKDWLLAIGFAIALIFGALLPDIDERQSSISHKLPLTSKIVAGFSKHRGIFHSVWIPIILILIAKFVISRYFALPNLVLVGLVVGYVSHLLADGMTVDGVAPFHPVKWKIRGFIKTGSILEIFLVLLVFTYLLMK